MHRQKLPLLLAAIFLHSIIFTQADWPEDCPSICKCQWRLGKTSASCKNKNISSVPNGLTTELQVLDLSENSLKKLPSNTFYDVALINLQKLILRSCNIEEIHKNAFHRLDLLYELDLTDNNLKIVPSLHDLSKIRTIRLQNNIIERIDQGSFSNFKSLKEVDLSKNSITHINEKAFTNDPNLEKLALNDNLLKQMNPIVLNPNQILGNLMLHNNPWNCDCNLKQLRDWTIQTKVYNSLMKCHEPQHLADKEWSETSLENFVCKPVILSPLINSTISLEKDKNQTVSCLVYGDPVPTVNWVLNNWVMNGASCFTVHADEGSLMTRWVNLTLQISGPQDGGELICSAKNIGGVEERIVSVSVL